MNQVKSWGRYPHVEVRAVEPVRLPQLPDLAQFEETVPPYGCGRSYGGSCINEGGVTLDMNSIKNFLSFDPQTGTGWGHS